MIRNIIKIDEEKCTGCGLCVPSCAEGALQIVNGKAKLVAEVYCDGLGACLGECPEGALTIEQREADAFDEEAVKEMMEADKQPETPQIQSGCCPGTALRNLVRESDAPATEAVVRDTESLLGHWPVQLMLIPPAATFLKGADIVICADCVPFAAPDFHRRYLNDKAVLLGCPKLDDLAFYRKKLAAVFREASPKSITVLRMEVPCCGGIVGAAIEARDLVCPDMLINVDIIGIRGEINSTQY